MLRRLFLRKQETDRRRSCLQHSHDGLPRKPHRPSYEGQLLVTTYPILGNYGVPSAEVKQSDISEYFESSKIHCSAIICQDYSWNASHWLATRTLEQWLREENIPGIYGVDTRALTKLLRSKGTMLGKIIFEGEPDIDFRDPNEENLIDRVSIKEIKEFGGEGKHVVLVDCGTKYNIIRCLLRRGSVSPLYPGTTTSTTWIMTVCS